MACVDSALPDIIAIPFEKLKSFGEFGRLGLDQARRTEFGLAPWEVLPNETKTRSDAVLPWQELAMEVGETFIPATEVYVEISQIDPLESFNIMVSHCWMRGFPAAPGYDKRAHTDDAGNNKYKLCVEGIERMWKAMAPGLTECYVWVDFSCINQDGDPSGELRQLASIVAWCDVIFTPIVDLDFLTSPWTMPSTLSLDGLFKDYKAPLWNQGNFAYLNRCWCRLEMLYCLAPLSPDAALASRLERMQAGLLHAMSNNRRLHVLFGTREAEGLIAPLSLPPLQYSWFHKYDPEKGAITQEADRVKIAAEVRKLEPYKHTLRIGYVGERNSEGQAHGRGTWRWDDGNLYEGEWKYGKKEGRGVFRWPAGDVYEGEWKDDKHEGLGMFRWASGSVYEGEWKDGKSEGHGVFTSASGDVYEGEWKDDKKEGYGVYSYADGELYEGEWRDGRWEGRGKYRWVSGSLYEGEFMNGNFHGQGVKKFADGRVQDGEWKDDEFLGPSTQP